MARTTRKSRSSKSHHRTGHGHALSRSRSSHSLSRTRRKWRTEGPETWRTSSVTGATRQATNIATAGAQGLAYGLELMALPFTMMLAIAMATMPMPQMRGSEGSSHR